jgi:hypothetical protein
MEKTFKPKLICDVPHDGIDYTVRHVDEWHGRDVEPKSGMIWATDGRTVWIERMSELNNLNLHPEIKYWTTADAPMPPKVV